jgi:aryl-alcohol dehydrogenase-like predicted oxidoreductase
VEKRRFGNTDLELSVLGFGGAEIGFEGAPQSDVEALLNSALDAGLNVIDTAECYADSEEKIGRAVGKRRDEFHLFTKIGHSSGFSEADWDPAMLAKQIDRGLQRLQTDRVDLIQLHSCSEDLLRKGDVVDILKRAKEAGKTRYIGYSGDSMAAKYAVDCGAFDALQTSVNIADQESIDLTLPTAAAKGMGVIAKRPIANVAWVKGTDPGSYGYVYWQRLQELQFPFLSQSDAVSVALRFTLAQPGVCVAIVGTVKPERWAKNAQLLEAGPLPRETVDAIRTRWAECRKPDWTGQT